MANGFGLGPGLDCTTPFITVPVLITADCRGGVSAAEFFVGVESLAIDVAALSQNSASGILFAPETPVSGEPQGLLLVSADCTALAGMLLAAEMTQTKQDSF